MTVYCKVLKKRVSTIRYPCKGRYELCPVYQMARRMEEERRVVEEKPKEEVREVTVEVRPAEPSPTPPAREPETAPTPPPPPPRPEQPTLQTARAEEAVEIKPERRVIEEPTLLDLTDVSMIVIRAKLEKTFSASVDELVDKGCGALAEDKMGLIVGRGENIIFYAICFRGRMLSPIAEHENNFITGRDAIEAARGLRLSVRLYSFDESVDEDLARRVRELVKG